MKKGRFENTDGRKLPLGVLGAVFLVLILLALLLNNCKGAPNMKDDPTTTETTVQKNEGSISIPGYEMLELKADSKKQSLSMPNPAQNNCYFEISLYLEDGTLLWKSALIEPGEVSNPLVLMKELSKGYYPKSVLRYACFAMDEDCTPLNGAETKVTLWVK